MQNHGHYIASLSEIVRWLGEKAEGMGINIFTGFPVASLVMEGEKVVGVRTTPTGVMRDGTPGSAFTPPTDISARVTVLSEGTRGSLAQAWHGTGGHQVRQSADLRARREGNLGDEEAPRRDRSHSWLAAAQ